MERAVIDQVGRTGRRLEIMLGVSTRKLLVRLAILTATIAVVALFAWQYGDYAAVFFNRLALGSDRYRTETVIQSVSINGQPVDLLWDGFEIRPTNASGPESGEGEIKCAYGQPIRFEATCSGRLPPVGRAMLQTKGAPEKEIILQPRGPHPNPLPKGEGTGQLYAGQSDRLFQDDRLPDRRGRRPHAVHSAGGHAAAGGGHVLGGHAPQLLHRPGADRDARRAAAARGHGRLAHPAPHYRGQTAPASHADAQAARRPESRVESRE